MACLRAYRVVLAAALLFIAHLPLSQAAGGCEEWAARLVSLQGRVEHRTLGGAAWTQASTDARLCPGDALRTGANSRAAVLLQNETLVRLDQLTTVNFPEPAAQEQNFLLDIIQGVGFFFSRTPKRLEFRSPFVNAAVEGTEFLVSVAPGKISRVAVFEGKVRVNNARGELLLASGEEAVAGPGEAPTKRLIARPRDVVAWALYYPPIVDYPSGDAPEEIQAAVDEFNRGDVEGALAALDRVPRTLRGVKFYTLRASILLYVGQVETAQVDLDAALKKDPENPDALAMHSIADLVLDRREQAYRLARRAADSSPRAVAPHIALSYVHQSRFDLEEARKSARLAAELDPRNALAWARLAELDLALRELDAAQQAAETATSLNPDLSRTQTTLGFAQLVRFDTDEAARSFDRAIELDQGDPLPRLGLGIAKIQRGQLEDGRQQIEIAASIDPANSIIRSYLGKAYFDEKRDALAGTEYEIAKELDPSDPTPWFYDAIRKQTANRPVDALDDVRRSVELNDNRAVFRSSLALDSDLAARSASQARIYEDLGFEDLALVKGWSSVSGQPGNFSAHRFLADAYVGKPRFEVARASEFLQSQLWQPLNLNPIQPQLAQSNLGIIQSAGPTLAGLNEYNPLFLRDGVQLQANLIGGDDNTFANDLALSTVKGRFSLGVGQFHFETDGFRPNADQKQDLYNLFLQFSPSPRASVQVEYRRYEADLGDTVLRFDPEDFFPENRFQRTSDTFRAGGRYEFSPRSKVIASVIGEEFELDQREINELPTLAPTTLTLEAHTKSRSLSGEILHVYAGNRFNLVSGLGYLTAKPKTKGEITRGQPPSSSQPPLSPPSSGPPSSPPSSGPPSSPPSSGPPSSPPSSGPPSSPPSSGRPPSSPPAASANPSGNEQVFENYKAYVYTNYAINKALTINAGLSYNECTNPVLDRSQLDPKLGLSWRVTKATEVRTAFFKTVRCVGADPRKPALGLPQPANQTVEPTQVAGFNQLFNDSSSSTSNVYGIALDHEVTAHLFAGGSVTRRDIKFPFRVQGDLEKAKWREDYAQTYLNLALDENWVLSLAYQYEMQDYTEFTAITGTSQLKTRRVPVSLRFFSESGLSAGITANYIDQEIQLFDTTDPEASENAQERFWLVDASLVYRLPKRYGFVSLEARNLFDAQFRFQEPAPNVPTLYPDRLFLARLSLNFN